MTTPLAADVFRDNVVKGDIHSEPHKLDKAEVRRWGTYLETIFTAATSGSFKVYETKSEMLLDLTPAANTAAIVVSDPALDSDNNGLYTKRGASGSGTWVRIGDIPGMSVIRAENVGDGTANAIEATTVSALPSIDGAALILLPIVANNTNTATVSFNGNPALTIVDATGASVTADGLIEGMVAAGFVEGDNFRLLTHQADANVAAAAASATAADGHADRAETALATIQAIDPALGGDIVAPWNYKRPTLPGMPKYSMLEPLVIREGVLTWRDADGVLSMPTEDFIRRQIFGQAYLGVSWPIPAYFDLLGVRFHRAPISQWSEITGAAHYDWHTGMSAATEDADYAGVWYQACLDANVAKVAGIGRQGDTFLTDDLAAVYKGGSDPLRGSRTVAQRVDQAVLRAQELAYHLTQFYGDWDGFYIGHEVDHIAACTELMHRIMYVPQGIYPALKSYTGVKIIIAMSSPEDAAVSTGIASLIATWGADAIMEQGSVGTGQKEIGGVYVPTYIPNETIPEIPARSLEFAQMIGLAASIQGSTIEKVWNCEAWRMGTEPLANITLSSLNGTSVTVTTSGAVAAFDASLVGAGVEWSLYGADGGSGLITARTDATQITINADTGDGISGNFTDLTMDAGEWSLSPGYTDEFAYPVGWPTIDAEIAGVDDAIDSLLLYGVDGYVALPNATVWPEEASRGRTDYKTRMIAEGNDWADAYETALDLALASGFADPLAKFTVDWSNITNKPAQAVAWADVSGKPTTVAGYGISDALGSTSKTAYTPSITFATPGDLAVTYATRLGWYKEVDGFVIAGGRILTSAFTHTSANGSFRITLPFSNDDDVAGENISGSLMMSGWTKAGYTQVGLSLAPDADYFNVWLTGSGQAMATMLVADVPTGGTISLLWQVMYKKKV